MIRCLNCMSEYDAILSTCPYCGAWKNVEQSDKEYLPSGTILGDRYIIGIAAKRTDSYVCYAAWDKAVEKKMVALEFFPQSLASRSHNSNNITPISQEIRDLFDDAVKEFVENKSFGTVYKIHANNTVYLFCEKIPADSNGERKLKMSLPLAVLLCFAAAAVIITTVFAISGMLKSDRRNFAAVPDLAGMNLNDAIDVAAAADFDIEVTGRIYGFDTTEDAVMSQSESAGKLADTKNKIGIVIGGGPGYAVMPDFLYLSADNLMSNENYIKLTEDGIKVVIDKTDKSSSLPILISAQDPEPGMVLREGDTVTLITVSDVAAGAIGKLSQAACPDICGKTFEEAKAFLKVSGFTTVCASYIYSEGSAGTIASQYPAAGETAYNGSVIFVDLYAGSRNDAVPDLYGMDEDEALIFLKNVCYSVKYEYDSGDDVAEGCIYNQDTEKGSVLTENDTLVLYVRSDVEKSPVTIEKKASAVDAEYSIGSPGSIHMNIGDAVGYTIPLYKTDGSEADGIINDSGTWISSDSSVVLITEDRKLNAVSEGISIIGVYYHGAIMQFPVAVTDPKNYIKVSAADADHGKILENILKEAGIEYTVVLLKGEAETGWVLNIDGTVYEDAEYCYISKNTPVTIYESRGNKDNYYKIKDFTVLGMTEKEVTAMLDIAGVTEYSFQYERSEHKEGYVYRATYKGFEEDGYIYVLADTPVILFISTGN